MTVLFAAFTFYHYELLSSTRPKDVRQNDLYATYDFVIIGAGSAGSVVANRLTEIENWNVLLLEAGGYESELSDIPYLERGLINSDLDWQFVMEPTPGSCLG